MKEMSVKEIQEVSLCLLKNIHDFCVKNSIRYSLGYGTLIGAIRHNGFIPWDDDAEIFMPRPDYDKFIQLYQDSDEYRLLAPERKNSNKTYARLCEIKRTTAKVLLPWFEGSNGVWIDIFPIDGVAEDECEREADNSLICKLNEDLCRYRQGKCKLSSQLNLRFIIKTLIYRMMGSLYFLESLQKKVQSLMKNHSFYTSKYCGNLGFIGYIKKEKLPRESFEFYELHKFEDANFYIIRDYDKNLRNYYGDYMTPPPLEKRNPVHTDAQRFYWREQ